MRRFGRPDWFEKNFGFKELNTNPYIKLNELYLKGNKTQLCGIDIGKFELLNINELYEKINEFNLGKSGNLGKSVIKNIVINDIKDIHNECMDNSTFQIASQLNCLEMINMDSIPAEGITIYKKDKTQGPQAVICTPAGIAYRNYTYNGGQTRFNQIDLSLDLLTHLKSIDNEIDWDVINGYLYINKINQIYKINEILDLQIIKDYSKTLIKAGCHFGLGLNSISDKHVNHILCGGIPISYNRSRINYDLWDNLSEIFLDAYYEITLF